MRAVEENNANKSTGYELEINKLAHFSYDELVNLRTGYVPLPDDQNFPKEAYNISRRGGRASLPASWDWRGRYGVVRPVQDQGNCGSCWAFAGIAVLEGQLSLKKRNHDKLSEQEAVECIRKYKDFGCGGGWGPEVFYWASTVGGVTTANRRPYKAVDYTSCNTDANPRSPGSKTVAGYVYITGEYEDAMKDAIVNVGPIHVSLHMSSDMAAYSSGIFSDSKNQCANQGNNHAVLLVGYGSENGQDYWLVKNSWGSWWGDQGYIKIARGRKLCGIARDAHWPMLA